MKFEDMTVSDVQAVVNEYRDRGVDISISFPDIYEGEVKDLSQPNITERASWLSFRIPWDAELTHEYIDERIIDKQEDAVQKAKNVLSDVREMADKVKIKLKGLLESPVKGGDNI